MPRIFLSHAGVDTNKAYALAEKLRNVPSDNNEDDIEVFLDKDNMAVGRNWQKQLEDEILEHCDCFAVYVGDTGVVNWVEREVRLALNRAGQDPEFKFITILETSKVDISDLPGFMREYQACSNIIRDADQFQRFVTAIYDEDGLIPTPITQDPFLGLNAFSIKDAHLFFGRDKEIQDTLSILKESNLLMVVGDSGSGKSSLVKAGLLSAYLGNELAPDNERSKKIWSYLETRPTDRPIEALANSIATYARGLGASQDDINTFRDMVRSGDAQRVRDALSDASTERAEILLIIDQFEEVFSLANDEERDKYIEIVDFLSDADNSGHIKVVLTMRRDYYNLCSSYKELFAKLESKELVAKYSLPRMANEQLEACIREPLELAGAAGHCSDEFVNEVISDVGDQPGDLALLELALRETWLLHRASKMDLLSCYSAIGKTAGALAKKADKVYTNLDQHQQGLAQAAFIRLVQLGDTGGTTRRVASRQEFDDSTWITLSQFASEEGGRLVTISTKVDLDIDLSQSDSELLNNDLEEQHCDYVEISHEAIVRQWPRYQSWLQSMSRRKRIQDRFLKKFEVWQKDQQSKELWLQSMSRRKRIQDRFLKKFEVWRKGQQSKEPLLTKYETQEAKHLLRSQIGWLNHHEKEYLKHSINKHKKQTIISYSLICLLVLATISSMWSTIQNKLANLKYEHQLVTSNDHLSKFLLERVDNQVALIDKLPYLLKALSLDTSTETDLALLKKHREVAGRLATPSKYQLLQNIYLTERSVLIDANNNGFIAEVSKTNQIVLYDIVSGNKVGEPINPAFKVLKFFVFNNTDIKSIARRQTTIVLVGSQRIEVRSLDTGQLLYEHIASVQSISNTLISADGKKLISASHNGHIKVWTLNSKDQDPHTIGGSFEKITTLAISPDSKTLVSGSESGLIRVWSLDNIDQDPNPKILKSHLSRVHSLAISPDGKKLVSSSGNTIKVWDLDNIDQPPHTFDDHTDRITSLAISSDGNTLVSGSNDNTIKVWDLINKDQQPHTFDTPIGLMPKLVISPDNNTLFSATFLDGSIKMWSLDNMDQPPRPLEGHLKRAIRLATSPDAKTLIGRSRYGAIKVWNLDDKGQVPYTFGRRDKVVNIPEISSDNSTLAIGSTDGTVKVWKLSNIHQPPDTFDGDGFVSLSLDGRTMASSMGFKDIIVRNLDRKEQSPRTLAVINSWVTSLSISPDGNTLASGLGDGTIKVWNLVEIDGAPQSFKGHGDRVGRLVISPDGNTLASGSSDGVIKVWNLNKLDQPPHTFDKKSGLAMSLAISHNGSKLVSGLTDGNIKVWDLKIKDRDPHILMGHSKEVLSLAISQDGRRLVSGSSDGSIKVWDLDNKGPALNTFWTDDGSPVSDLAMSSDGNRVTSGSSQGNIKVWNLEQSGQAPNGNVKHRLGRFDVHFFIGLAGEILVSDAGDGFIKVWDLDREGQPPRILNGHSGMVESFAISPNGKTLVSGFYDGIIMVSNLDNKEQAPLTFQGHTKQVKSLAISNDSKTLVSVGESREMKIWDLDDIDAAPATLPGRFGSEIAISPDGNTLVNTWFTGEIKVFDLNNKGEEPYTLEGRPYVRSLAISPDGNFLACGYRDGIIEVWNLNDKGQAPHTFNGHRRWVDSLSFSPDGNTLVSGAWGLPKKTWSLLPILALFEFDRWSKSNKDQLPIFFESLELKIKQAYGVELDSDFQITGAENPFKPNLYEPIVFDEENFLPQRDIEHFGIVPYHELIQTTIKEIENAE